MSYYRILLGFTVKHYKQFGTLISTEEYCFPYNTHGSQVKQTKSGKVSQRKKQIILL